MYVWKVHVVEATYELVLLGYCEEPFGLLPTCSRHVPGTNDIE